MSALAGKKLFTAMLLSALLCVIAGSCSSALARGTSSAPCDIGGMGHSSYGSHLITPKAQPILVGPIIVGCGSRLGEPIRFIAYVQATRGDGEQLCYVLEQVRQKSALGGGCFQTAPSLERCSEDCFLSVEPTVVGWGGQASKGSLVTGAAFGVIEEVTLETSPLGKKRATAPFTVVLEGEIQEELRLPSVVSLFASVVVPCLPPGQPVYASGKASGEEFEMRGSDPFGCHA